MRSDRRGPKAAGGVLHYGPNRFWWGMALVALAIVVVPPCLLLLATSSGPDPREWLLVGGSWLLVVGALAFGFPSSWTRFSVRRDGLHQRTLRGSWFRPWEELGRIGSEEMGPGPSEEPDRLWIGDRGIGLPVAAATEPSAFYIVIRDVKGEQAFRIPPWVSFRRHLIAEIRSRIRDTR